MMSQVSDVRDAIKAIVRNNVIDPKSYQMFKAQLHSKKKEYYPSEEQTDMSKSINVNINCVNNVVNVLVDKNIKSENKKGAVQNMTTFRSGAKETPLNNSQTSPVKAKHSFLLTNKKDAPKRVENKETMNREMNKYVSTLKKPQPEKDLLARQPSSRSISNRTNEFSYLNKDACPNITSSNRHFLLQRLD